MSKNNIKCSFCKEDQSITYRLLNREKICKPCGLVYAEKTTCIFCPCGHELIEMKSPEKRYCRGCWDYFLPLLFSSSSIYTPINAGVPILKFTPKTLKYLKIS